MKTQLTTFARWLISDPQRICVAVTLLVFCLILIALLLPSVTTLADGLPGGGSFLR